MKEKKQLQGKTVAELTTDYEKMRVELAALLLDKAQVKLKNTSSLRNKRRDMAVIQTKMTEKRLLEQEK